MSHPLRNPHLKAVESADDREHDAVRPTAETGLQDRLAEILGPAFPEAAGFIKAGKVDPVDGDPVGPVLRDAGVVAELLALQSEQDLQPSLIGEASWLILRLIRLGQGLAHDREQERAGTDNPPRNLSRPIVYSHDDDNGVLFVVWPEVRRVCRQMLSRDHRDDPEADRTVRDAMLAAGAPSWVRDAERFVDAHGCGFHRPAGSTAADAATGTPETPDDHGRNQTDGGHSQ